jgi:pre-rRNA-processing protein TSR3
VCVAHAYYIVIRDNTGAGKCNAKPHKLSSVEALAAALIIMGFRESAVRLLGLFKWGESFLTLNHEPLESYSLAGTTGDMSAAEAQFF